MWTKWGEIMSGVTRDFSENRKSVLTAQVRAVNQDGQWCFFDEVGDIVSWFSARFGELQIENYLNRIDEYHKKIIDQKDITQKELEEIFRDVEHTDAEYRYEFASLNEGLERYRKSLLQMANMINPANRIFTSENLKKAAALVKTDIDAGSAKIEAVFNTELVYMQDEILKNALKEFTGDILSLGIDVMKFTVQVVKKDPAGTVVSLWQTVNDTCALLGDVGALAGGAVCVGATLFGVKGINKIKKKILEEAEEHQNIESIAEVFERAEQDDIAKIANGINAMADAYDLYDSAKGIMEGANKLDRVLTDGRYNKKARLEEMLLEEVGYKSMNTPYVYKKDAVVPAKMQKKIVDTKNKWSNVKQTYKYVTGALEGMAGEKMVETTSMGGFASDVKDFLEEAGDFLTDDLGLPGVGDIVCMLN